MEAHYHCIICSATITRKTDMVGHLSRHVNKGETESRYTPGKYIHNRIDFAGRCCALFLFGVERQVRLFFY